MGISNSPAVVVVLIGLLTLPAAAVAQTNVYTYRVPQTAFNYEGHVVESGVSPVVFGVEGTVRTVIVSEGQTVEWGDALAELNSDSIQSQLDLADAQASLMAFQVSELVEEYDRLSPGGPTPNSIMLLQVQANLDNAMASQSAQEAAVEVLRQQLANTVLVAAERGTVVQVHVSAGDIVTAAQPVVSLGPVGILIGLETQVPDDQVDHFRNAAEITVNVQEGAGVFSCPGTLGAVTDNGTGTSTLAIGLGNEVLGHRPAPGQTVQITVSVGDSAVRIPRPLVGNTTGFDFVYALEQGADGQLRARMRPVVLGAVDEQGLVQVTAGVGTGDLLVAPALPILAEGQLVLDAGLSPRF